MSSFGRLDVIVLALLFVYLSAIVIHVCWRYYLARRLPGIDAACGRALVASLNIEVGSLKSIAVTAPYLGLAGTCVGSLHALGGVAMNTGTFRAMVETRIAAAPITTAVGILVGALGIYSYSYLRTRIDLLGGEVFGEGQQRGRHFLGAREYLQSQRFSQLPAFTLLAAPALAIAITGCMTFASLRPPTGLYVEVPSGRCEHDSDDRLIVLHITDTGRVFLNQEQQDWSSLSDRLSQIYRMREHRTLYLLADSDVPFQTVARAIDTVENAPATAGPKSGSMRKDKLGMKVQLMTPKALDAACSADLGHPVLR